MGNINVCRSDDAAEFDEWKHDFQTGTLTPKRKSPTPDSKRFPGGIVLYDEEELVEHVDILVNYTQSVSLRHKKCITSSPCALSRPTTNRSSIQSFCFSPVVDMVELQTIRRCIMTPKMNLDGTPRRGFASPTIVTHRSSLTFTVPRRSSAQPELIQVLRQFQKQQYQQQNSNLDWSKAVKRLPETSSSTIKSTDSSKEKLTPHGSSEDFLFLNNCKTETLRTASVLSFGGDFLLSPSIVE